MIHTQRKSEIGKLESKIKEIFSSSLLFQIVSRVVDWLAFQLHLLPNTCLLQARQTIYIFFHSFLFASCPIHSCKLLKDRNLFFHFSWPYSLHLAWRSPHNERVPNQFLLNLGLSELSHRLTFLSLPESLAYSWLKHITGAEAMDSICS